MVSTKTRMIVDPGSQTTFPEAPQGRFKREATRGSVLRLFGGLSVCCSARSGTRCPAPAINVLPQV